MEGNRKERRIGIAQRDVEKLEAIKSLLCSEQLKRRCELGEEGRGFDFTTVSAKRILGWRIKVKGKAGALRVYCFALMIVCKRSSPRKSQ